MDREKIERIAESDAEGLRIDKYLTILEPNLSRSYLQKLIAEGHITVNDRIVKANYRISEGDELSYFIPAPAELCILPEPIPLEILYEDSDIIVINKEKGMVVHPAAGHTTGTLVNGLLYHCKDSLSGINGIARPGIVHRIDKDTTGVLVVCKNDHSHQRIAEQLKVHSITRRYHAICYRSFEQQEGRVEAPIGRHPTDRKKMAVNHRNGKPAITNYRVLETLSEKYSYIECTLETGRTHQIRVHLSSIGHPILGDTVYGSAKNEFHLQGQTLHAKILGFQHPTTGSYMEFEAPLPDYFKQLLSKLRK